VKYSAVYLPNPDNFWIRYYWKMDSDTSSTDLLHAHAPKAMSSSVETSEDTIGRVCLVWKDLQVRSTRKNKKILLDNVSGIITGGFWAIMVGVSPFFGFSREGTLWFWKDDPLEHVILPARQRDESMMPTFLYNFSDKHR
jgi:hypothetical protein